MLYYMRTVLAVIGICVVLPALADTHLDVSQLVGNITTALAVDRNDQRIARSLKSIRLTERLTTETFELLVRMGIGPDTTRALEALWRHSSGLPAPAQEVLSLTPFLSDFEQREMIDRTQRYALEYLAHFPRYAATEIVRQYHNYEIANVPGYTFGREDTVLSLDDRWHRGVAYTAEATYSASGEIHGDSPAGASERKGVVKVSVGEFGGMMEEIFDRSRGAQFRWVRWQALNGIRTAVFSYNVSLESSRYSVCCRTVLPEEGKVRQEYVKAGHRGLVFVDPQTAVITRLILYATDLIDASDVKAAASVLDYGEVDLGGIRYWLPVRSTAYVRVGRCESREETEYRNHHKFSTESTIKFGATPPPPQ